MPNRELDTAYYALSRRINRIERSASRSAAHQTWTGRTAESVPAPSTITIPAYDGTTRWSNAIVNPKVFPSITVSPGAHLIQLNSFLFWEDTTDVSQGWVNIGLYSLTLPNVIHWTSFRTFIPTLVVGSTIIQPKQYFYDFSASAVFNFTSEQTLDLLIEGNITAAQGGNGQVAQITSPPTRVDNNRWTVVPV